MKRNINIVSVLFTVLILVSMMSCNNSITDKRDGNKYKVVKIGKQVWMAENLRYLPEITAKEEASTTAPNYYVYDYEGNDVQAALQTSNYKVFGTLYNWEAAKTACPSGWHLPTAEEYQAMEDYLGGTAIAAGKMKSNEAKLWKDMITDTSNHSGFSAIPGGYHANETENYKFADKDNYAVFWTSTIDSISQLADYRILFDNGMAGCQAVRHSSAPTDYAISVRCIKD